jgi:hypothetical protein
MYMDSKTPAAEQYARRALEHIVHLAQMIGGRGSCTPDERRGADYAADQMRRIGAQDVHLERFRGAASAYNRYVLAFGVALAGTLLNFAWRERAAALVAAALYGLGIWGMLAESDFTPNWTRLIIPGRPSQNVVAHQPPRRQAAQRVVLTAHLDSHRSPVFNLRIWPRIYVGAFRGLSGALVVGALLHLLSALSSQDWIAWAALFPALALLLGAVLLMLADLTPFSPGAYDNASGVGSVLGLAERLARQPLDGTEVWFALTGCEETGAAGMESLLPTHRQAWREAVLINLDQMGQGRLYVRVCEGMIIRRRPRPEMLALCRRVQESLPHLGVFERPSQAFSDAAVAYRHGFNALSFGTRPRGTDERIHRHQMSDTVEHIQPGALRDTQAFLWRLLQDIDRAPDGVLRE